MRKKTVRRRNSLYMQLPGGLSFGWDEPTLAKFRSVRARMRAALLSRKEAHRMTEGSRSPKRHEEISGSESAEPPSNLNGSESIN